MEETNVLVRSQIIVVEPISNSVAVINAGPQGPPGSPGGPTPVDGFTTLEFMETMVSTDPAANKTWLYTKDNGAGKTELHARFANGYDVIIIDDTGLGTDSGKYSHRYVQPIPSLIWEVYHTLGFRPSVTVVDSAGEVIIPEIEYISDTKIELSFSAEVSGEAYLS